MPIEIKRLAVVAVATVGAFSSASLVLAGSAAAALPPGCSAASGTVTCTFSFTGAAQSFTVPSGVNSITVAAFGAQGGDVWWVGGEAQAVFAVFPGAAVEVLVGGQGGTSTGAQTGAAGGFNGAARAAMAVPPRSARARARAGGFWRGWRLGRADGDVRELAELRSGRPRAGRQWWWWPQC